MRCEIELMLRGAVEMCVGRWWKGGPAAWLLLCGMWADTHKAWHVRGALSSVKPV